MSMTKTRSRWPWLFALPLLSVTGGAHAEADGPDFWKVVGVAADDVLNLRAESNPRAPKVGEIPPGATCVRNLGCVGGLTLARYTELSEAERVAAKKANPRWCKVEYQGQRGWVAGRYLAEGDCEAKDSGDR